MKKFLKILKWTGISLGGLLIVLIVIDILNPAPSKPLSAAPAPSAHPAPNIAASAPSATPTLKPVAATTTPTPVATPKPTVAPTATPTPQPVATPAPTPEPQPSQPSQAEMDAAAKEMAQFKLDMLTSDIASDIRAEDKHLVLLDSILQQGKTQQAYSSAQSMSDRIDRYQKMYQTIANELEDSPIKAKLKDIAINAETNIGIYQYGYRDYMKFLDSGKQSDLYSATQNFALAKSSMQDLENQLVKMGGHDQNQ